MSRSHDERRVSYDEVRRRHHTADVERDLINEDDEANKADDEEDEEGMAHAACITMWPYLFTAN